MRLIAVQLLVVGLSVSACGGGDDKPESKPTTQGTSLPVAIVQGRLVEVGGPQGTDDTPVPGTITLKSTNGSTVRAEVGDDGRFQVQTNPGSYRITGRSPKYGDGQTDCTTAKPVTELTLGETVSVDVTCQVK